MKLVEGLRNPAIAPRVPRDGLRLGWNRGGPDGTDLTLRNLGGLMIAERDYLIDGIRVYGSRVQTPESDSKFLQLTSTGMGLLIGTSIPDLDPFKEAIAHFQWHLEYTKQHPAETLLQPNGRERFARGVRNLIGAQTEDTQAIYDELVRHEIVSKAAIELLKPFAAVSQTSTFQPQEESGVSQVPLSDRITPTSPSFEGAEIPRSELYSEAKLRKDYILFCKELPGFNPDRPISELQRDLFRLYEQKTSWPEGDRIMGDPMQAWEWMLARIWHEWDAHEKEIVRKNLSPAELKEFGHLLG